VVPSPASRLASDDLRLRPALDWIEAALAQQNADAVASLTGAVAIEVTGTSARVITVGDGDVVATIASDAPTLVRWATQRGSWEELGLQVAGDEQALAVARSFKVF
jgi:hypothetical protein